MDDRDVRVRVAQAEHLLAEMEAFPDPKSRAVAVETVQILLELYGEGLARMVAHAARLGGERMLEAFAADELIAHLLLLHGLHPEDVESRVQQALADLRPQMAAHGGSVELLGVVEGVAHLRLVGSCQGCPSSAATLQSTVERAIQVAAPDLLGIEFAGVGGQATAPAPNLTGFVPVSTLIQLEEVAGDG